MVSGIPTSSGYEERIRFSEMEVVDRSANEQGLLVNMPEGNVINGWDVNIAAVRTTLVRRTLRYHQHAVCKQPPAFVASGTSSHWWFAGIPDSSSSRKWLQYIHWSALWWLREIAQKSTSRAPREGHTSSPKEKQKLSIVIVSWFKYRWRCIVDIVRQYPRDKRESVYTKSCCSGNPKAQVFYLLS